MTDLIYGGDQYKKELLELFPKAKITDASDEVHEDRIGLETNIEDEKEYLRIIILNGFLELSLKAQLWVQDPDNTKEVNNLMASWKRKYPEYYA